MSKITATCPDCSEVALSSNDLTLLICRVEPTASRYHFVCPECGLDIEKPADQRVIDLLRPAGVAEEIIEPTPPTVSPVPGPHSDDPILTTDDLLDFHAILKDEDLFRPWLAGLLHVHNQEKNAR